MCPRVVIIHDSAAALPLDVRRIIDPTRRIEVPFRIRMKNTLTSWPDSPFLTQEENSIIAACLKTPELLETVQPEINDFLEAFIEAAESGAEELVIITIDSHLSGAINAASTAVDRFNALGYKLPVHIVDSKAASIIEGLIVEEAAEMASRNKSGADIAEWAGNQAKTIPVAMLLSSLDYLVAGGRITSRQGFLGGVLHVKAAISLIDGKVVPISTSNTDTIGWKRALEFAANYVANQVVGLPVRLAIAQYGALRELEMLQQIATPKFTLGDKTVLISEQVHVINVHVGPINIGLAAMPLNNPALS